MVVEPDPESTKYLFVVDEEQRVMKIIDAVKIAGDKSALDIKTNVKSVIDMAKHSLDDELLILDQKPF